MTWLKGLRKDATEKNVLYRSSYVSTNEEKLILETSTEKGGGGGGGGEEDNFLLHS